MRRGLQHHRGDSTPRASGIASGIRPRVGALASGRQRCSLSVAESSDASQRSESRCTSPDFGALGGQGMHCSLVGAVVFLRTRLEGGIAPLGRNDPGSAWHCVVAFLWGGRALASLAQGSPSLNVVCDASRAVWRLDSARGRIQPTASSDRHKHTPTDACPPRWFKGSKAGERTSSLFWAGSQQLSASIVFVEHQTGSGHRWSMWKPSAMPHCALCPRHYIS